VYSYTREEDLPPHGKEIMFKKCDECGKSFNVFEEGNGAQFFIVCGSCWAIESQRRQIGGVFTRYEKGSN
jgi:hypothetical protein